MFSKYIVCFFVIVQGMNFQILEGAHNRSVQQGGIRLNLPSCFKCRQRVCVCSQVVSGKIVGVNSPSVGVQKDLFCDPATVVDTSTHSALERNPRDPKVIQREREFHKEIELLKATWSLSQAEQARKAQEEQDALQAARHKAMEVLKAMCSLPKAEQACKAPEEQDVVQSARVAPINCGCDCSLA